MKLMKIKGLLKGVLIFDAVVAEWGRSVRFGWIQSGTDRAGQCQLCLVFAGCQLHLCQAWAEQDSEEFLCQGRGKTLSCAGFPSCCDASIQLFNWRNCYLFNIVHSL